MSMACRFMWPQQTWTPLWLGSQIWARDPWCAHAFSSVRHMVDSSGHHGTFAAI